MLYHISDELAGFEQAWRSNGERVSHGWNDAFEFPGNSGKLRAYYFSSLLLKGIFSIRVHGIL